MGGVRVSDGAGFFLAGAAVLIALIVTPCPTGMDESGTIRRKNDVRSQCMQTERTYEECERFVEAVQ
jgi:hypothetical protein